ncbi:MAG TPA: GDSL-type esterase/lipase family protein [Thermoanaerobaculia bacterium]|nr:GDSL-type esterase/lipase family protein [Thermoanaerobaculia bacterium]
MRPEILLLGDSIRMQYQPLVRESLGASAQLWGPQENCETSRRLLSQLPRLLAGHDPAIIHVNAGLHDIRYEPGASAPQVGPQEYASNLEAMFELLKETGARVIWATTTPIDERLHQRNKASRRYAADIEGYNAASRNLAAKHGVAVNDLCEAISTAGARDYLLEDGLHFNHRGYQILADRVTTAIRAAMKAVPAVR